MQDVYKTLAWLSTQIVPVLIESEPGSGKAEVARALHDMAGLDNAPYIEMNCAQIPQPQHKAHLFDEVEGLIAQAHNGTLFVNNVDQLAKDAQLQFARLLEGQSQERGSWPRRILVGSKQDLRQRVDADEFREDLYFALSVAPIKLPALRDRRQDIPAMANHFCERANESFQTSCSLSFSAQTALQDYDWPGNIKELDYAIRRLVMGGNGPQIEAYHVMQELGTQNEGGDAPYTSSLSDAADLHISNYFAALGTDEPPTDLYNRIIEEVERPLIIRTLYATKGNQIKAAQILGLNRNTLRKKIDLLMISKNRSDYKDPS